MSTSIFAAATEASSRRAPSPRATSLAGAPKSPTTSQVSALKKKKKLLNGANIKFTFPSGATYVGSFKDGKIEGYGVYTYAQSGDIYEGEWKADLKHGHGTYRFANGERYVGQWYMGNKHGKGQFVFLTGDEYIGSWRDNEMNGYGVFHLVENGDRYEGYWKGGLRQGQGTLIHGNGDLYDGEWDGGQQQGIGVFFQSNGDLFCGEWGGGAMDGKGVLREKGIIYLTEYVGGYLIAKLKLTDATDEADNDWAAVYQHYSQWIAEKETAQTTRRSAADTDKLKDDLDAAHAENSILRRRLDDVMNLLQSKARPSEHTAEASATTPTQTKEVTTAAYFRECLQKEETKTKLLECTLAERIMDARKLTEQLRSSDAKLKEVELARPARKLRTKSRKGDVSTLTADHDLVAVESVESALPEEFGDTAELEDLRQQSARLVQLNGELQQKAAFLFAENAKLDLRAEAAEEQYDKLLEEVQELHNRLERRESPKYASPTPSTNRQRSSSPSPKEGPVSPLSLASVKAMSDEELQQRLIQANQLTIELRLKNGDLQRKLRESTQKDSTVPTDTALGDLTDENETLRATITHLQKEIITLQDIADEAEQRLRVSMQRQAEVEETMKATTNQKSATPQLQKALEDKSDRIARLELENAELARLLEEAESNSGRGAAESPQPKMWVSKEPVLNEKDQDEHANLQKELKKLQRRVRKVTSERNTVAEQFYSSQVQLARAHRTLGALHGQLMVFASLSSMDNTTSSRAESVVKVDRADPSKLLLTDCGKETPYQLDYCFDEDATATQLLDEVRDAVEFVWAGFQFSMFTFGEYRSGKTRLTMETFPLLLHSIIKAAEEDPLRSLFSYTYRVAVVEVSAKGGLDCGSGEEMNEVFYDANGYIHPRKTRFIDCTSVSIIPIVDSLLSKRRQHYNGRAHTWIQLQCIRTGLVRQSQSVGRVTLFDWCGPGSLSLQKTDLESARFASTSSQTLRDVATALSVSPKTAPYSRSLETAMLFDMLGGNSLTAVIGRLRLSAEHVEESIRTLGILSSLFGSRNGPLFQDNQPSDEIRWRGIVAALSSDDQAERELRTVDDMHTY